MSKKINKVAVLGAGVMGSQISGHLSNAGIPSYLFDIDFKRAKKGRDSLIKLKPAPLFKPKNIDLITACTFDDDIEKISDADWVLEVVTEKIEVKKKVYEKIIPYLKNDSILTSNTSGIPITELNDSFTDDLKSRFMITHFFNPPRYMHLLELIRGEKTSEATYNKLNEFGEAVLGKGIVLA